MFIILVVESIRTTQDNLRLRLRDGETTFLFLYVFMSLIHSRPVRMI